MCGLGIYVNIPNAIKITPTFKKYLPIQPLKFNSPLNPICFSFSFAIPLFVIVLVENAVLIMVVAGVLQAEIINMSVYVYA